MTIGSFGRARLALRDQRRTRRLATDLSRVRGVCRRASERPGMTDRGGHQWRTSPRSMVKELREKTGAGMMDCKAALGETGGDMEARGRLAAQEGPGQGRQEGRPRRGRRPDRRRARRHQGRRRRGQFGNRLRRPQRPVPGPGQDDRRRRARRRRATSTSIQAAKIGDRTIAEAIAETIAKIGENMTLRRAPALSVEQGRGRELRAQFGDRRPRQDRRDRRARIAGQGRRARAYRPHGRHARRCRQSAGARCRRARRRP